ncbi:MAG: hypothetical protein ACYC3I_09335 [Gemmataceae bacterium]
MFASVRALLTELIDYAGLFPPARLPLDQAIRNYARYRQESDAWMLGLFIVPASRLEDLEPYHDELFRVDPPFTFSALGRGGRTLTEFLSNLRDDLRDVAAFRKRHGDRVSVNVLETRLPPDLADPDLPESAESLFKTVRVFPVAELYAFCESTGRAEELVEQLARLPGEHAGFKLRCGGLEASAFPSSEQIAAVLTRCCEAGIPFKATAGLHHPLPRFDATVQARMHGFINVFLAGAFAYCRNLSVEQIQRLLDDDQADHFTFTHKGVRWQKHRATTAEIAEARRNFVRSFGSCSFEEPRQDLRVLGWL